MKLPVIFLICAGVLSSCNDKVVEKPSIESLLSFMADSSFYITPFCLDLDGSLRPEIRFDTLEIDVPDDFYVSPGERFSFVFSEFDTTNIVQRLQKAYSRHQFDTSGCFPARRLRISIGYSFELVPVIYIGYASEKDATRSRIVGKYTYSFEEGRWRVYDNSDHNLWYWYTEGHKRKSKEIN